MPSSTSSKAPVRRLYTRACGNTCTSVGNRVQVRSVQDGICMLWTAHMRSASSLKRFRSEQVWRTHVRSGHVMSRHVKSGIYALWRVHMCSASSLRSRPPSPPRLPPTHTHKVWRTHSGQVSSIQFKTVF